MNLKDSAESFCQVCGVLASFGIGFVILLLTPAVFPGNPGSSQDLAVSLMLLSVALYSLASAVLANAMRFDYPSIRRPYAFGIICFHLANVITLGALAVIISTFHLPLASKVIEALVIVAGIVLAINIWPVAASFVRHVLFLRRLSPDRRALYDLIAGIDDMHESDEHQASD